MFYSRFKWDSDEYLEKLQKSIRNNSASTTNVVSLCLFVFTSQLDVVSCLVSSFLLRSRFLWYFSSFWCIKAHQNLIWNEMKRPRLKHNRDSLKSCFLCDDWRFIDLIIRVNLELGIKCPISGNLYAHDGPLNSSHFIIEEIKAKRLNNVVARDGSR